MIEKTINICIFIMVEQRNSTLRVLLLLEQGNKHTFPLVEFEPTTISLQSDAMPLHYGILEGAT